MKQKQMFKTERGVAGLEILVTVVVMLFMVGIIVMTFSIAGSKLQTAMLADAGEGRIDNETNSSAVGSGASATYTLPIAVTHANADCSIVRIGRANASVVYYESGLHTNFTVSNCIISKNGTTSGYVNGTPINVTYTYSYGDLDPARTINKTYQSMSSVPDWFQTFIVLTALVVLILLVVIIISAIKGAGIMGGHEGNGGMSGNA